MAAEQNVNFSIRFKLVCVCVAVRYYCITGKFLAITVLLKHMQRACCETKNKVLTKESYRDVRNNSKIKL